MSTEINASAIAGMLRRSADDLARKLLPNGRYEGAGEYKCSADNSPTGEAISVHIGSGPKQGVVGFWNSSREGGDILDLIEEVQGCTKHQAIEWAKSYLGFGRSREYLTNWRARENAGKTSRAEQAAARRKHHLSTASGIWRSAGELGDIAKSYFRSRGINLLSSDVSLRFHQGLPHPEGGTFPAIVARVVDKDGFGAAIWRIFLKSDGSGKAPVQNPKLGLGESAGCSVRLGGDGKEIGIAEGIETALACRELMVRDAEQEPIPIWAALSAPGLASFNPPKEVKHVRIFADADCPKFNKLGVLRKSPGMEAANKLKDRLAEQGIKATIVTPPEGMDWLDVLNAQKPMFSK